MQRASREGPVTDGWANGPGLGGVGVMEEGSQRDGRCMDVGGGCDLWVVAGPHGSGPQTCEGVRTWGPGTRGPGLR